MEFLKYMSVPAILFMLVVAPLWITMHYRSLNRSSRSLRQEDRETVEHMLETVDRLTDRIGALEAILDVDHPDWRQQVERRDTGRSDADE